MKTRRLRERTTAHVEVKFFDINSTRSTQLSTPLKLTFAKIKVADEAMSVSSRGPFTPQHFSNDFSYFPTTSTTSVVSMESNCETVPAPFFSQAPLMSTAPLSVTVTSAPHVPEHELRLGAPPPKYAMCSNHHSMFAHHQASDSDMTASQHKPFSLGKAYYKNLTDNFYPSSAPPDGSHFINRFNVSFKSLSLELLILGLVEGGPYCLISTP